MAVFTALAIGAAVVGAVSAIGQASAARRAARAQREANAVSSANQTTQNLLARRRAAREERIRRARIVQSSVNSGVSGSSGEQGAQSALRSNAGSALAGQSANLQANLGISAANQRAADARSSYTMWGDLGSFASGVFNFATSQQSS